MRISLPLACMLIVATSFAQQPTATDKPIAPSQKTARKTTPEATKAKPTPEEEWLYPAQRVSADLEDRTSRLKHDLHAVALTTLGSYWWKLDRSAAQRWVYPAVDEITIVPQEESDSDRSTRLEAARRVLAIVTPLDPILRERVKDVVTAASPREGNAGPTRFQTADTLIASAWDAPPAELARAISEAVQYGVTTSTVSAILRLAQNEPEEAQRLFDRALSQATAEPSEMQAFAVVLKMPADAVVPQGWKDTVLSSYARALGGAGLDPNARCSLATMLGGASRLADGSIPQTVQAALSDCMTGGTDAAADSQTIQRDAPQSSDEYLKVAGELKTPSQRYDMKMTAAEKAEQEAAKEKNPGPNDGPVKALRILDGMTPEERAVNPGQWKRERSDVAVRASLHEMGAGCSGGLSVIEASPRTTIFHVAVGVAEKVSGPCYGPVMDIAMRQMQRVPAEDPNDYVRMINLAVRKSRVPEIDLQRILRQMDNWSEKGQRTLAPDEIAIGAPWNKLYPIAIAQELFNISPEMLTAIAHGSFRNELLRIDFELFLVRGFLDRYAREAAKRKAEVASESAKP